ncbi:MAG: hypothetical protein A2042_06060 [Candidatus Schekmanbacteria bacterium GWA2_38_11]|uniref:DUF362 domain-containing protein n=1 Tax=Candidatus Schekmanbacteria bacterium GWA2_38_11 TaxID=1817876 RepID=A0A1F7RBE6_9BACT|nr:MAG: hypothetical protein A2042_06060 [Candidatus Schekmanbacteria bacterium GWA2_38_11]
MDEVIVKKIDDLDKDFNRILENFYRQKLFEGIDGKIIIKPNLCTIASRKSGVVSDIKIVEHLIKFFKEKKPDAEILIVESDSFDRDAEDVFTRLGYFDLQKKWNIRLLNLTKEESISIIIPGIPYELNLPKIFLKDFFFVSLANLKTHDYQKITCIFKNQFGCLPDRLKERYHPYLEETLYALDRFIDPDLCIVDGRIALEGNGPVDGEPLETGIMVIGNKSIAVDTVCAQIMGFKPEEVPYLNYAFKKSKYDYKKIKIAGDDLRFNFKFIPKKLYVGIRLKILITRTSVAITNFLKKLSFHILYFGIIQTFSRIPGYIKKQIVKQ